MRTPVHVELPALRRGMPVVVGHDTFGELVDVIPQPDRLHVSRMITRTAVDGKLVSIPVDWARNVEDGRIVLWIDQSELQDLPEYVPMISAAEAREHVQRALEEHPATARSRIEVREKGGTLELHGKVPDQETRATASSVARGVSGARPVRNRLRTQDDGASTVSAVAYGYASLHDWLERTTFLDLEEAQIARMERLAEHKMSDLFDVGEESAAANGRSRILRQDLPLTKGLQLMLLEVGDMTEQFEVEPLVLFLKDAGVRARIDEELNSEIPRLMSALLLMIAQVVNAIEPAGERSASSRPSAGAMDRACAVLDLVL